MHTTICSAAAKLSPSTRAPWRLALFAGAFALGGCAAPAETAPAEDVGEATAALSTVGTQYSLGNAALPGQCLDIEYGYTTDSMPAITWSCSGSANQRFSLIPVQGDFGLGAMPRYYVWAQHSGKCLDVEYGSNSPGARIIQYHCTQAVNQIFHLEPAGTGVWQLVAQGSGLCVASDGNGGVVQTQCMYTTPSQDWSLIPSSAPSVTIYRDVDDQGPSLTVSGDMPNLELPGQSYTDVASSLTLSGGAVVSLYSGANYTGTCQAFRHDEADLIGSPVGNDTVASLRMGAFCGTHQVTFTNDAVVWGRFRLQVDGVWQDFSSTLAVGGSATATFGDGSDVTFDIQMNGSDACTGTLSPWSDHTLELDGVSFSYGCKVDGSLQ